MIGGLLAGWEDIVGLEQESQYVDIGRARGKFWQGWVASGQTDPTVILKKATKNPEVVSGQLVLFDGV